MCPALEAEILLQTTEAMGEESNNSLSDDSTTRTKENEKQQSLAESDWVNRVITV